MIKNFTHLYRLRNLCKQLLALPDFLEANELEKLINDIAHAACDATFEQTQVYNEFLQLPYVYKLFDKWIEEREDNS